MVLLCLLAASVAASESLYEAPARYWDNLPIATLQVAGPGSAKRSLNLLIDSGANSSFLFPGHSVGSAVVGLSVSHAVSLGSVAFVATPKDKVSPQAAALMSRLGVDGSLGVDFLRTHDVLLDHAQGRIFFSRDQEPDATDSLGKLSIIHAGRSSVIDLSVPRIQFLTLVEQDDIFFVPASVLDGGSTACLMALDTGTGESALSLLLTSKLKRTGIKRKIVSFQGRLISANEFRATIAIAETPPRSFTVLGSDATGPILGGNAFQDRKLFLQLRFSRALSW